MTIDPRVLEAYLDYSGDQARAGILNCRCFEEALLADTSVEEFMRDELAAAGIEVPGD